MQITGDSVLQYWTAKQGVSEGKALKRSLEAKLKEFVEKGAEIYVRR